MISSSSAVFAQTSLLATAVTLERFVCSVFTGIIYRKHNKNTGNRRRRHLPIHETPLVASQYELLRTTSSTKVRTILKRANFTRAATLAVYRLEQKFEDIWNSKGFSTYQYIVLLATWETRGCIYVCCQAVRCSYVHNLQDESTPKPQTCLLELDVARPIGHSARVQGARLGV